MHNFKYVTLHRNPEILFQQHSFAMEAKFRSEAKFTFIDTHERIMQKSIPTQQELWLEQLARRNFWSFSLSELENSSFRSFFADKIENVTSNTFSLVHVLRSVTLIITYFYGV